MKDFVRPDIIEMKPYTPIVPFEVLSKRLGRDPQEIVKLDANENPYGPSPKALEALRNGQFFHIYPDPEANMLRSALADYVQMPRERLMAGMGADELIDLVLRVILAPDDVVVDAPPSFGMYPFSTAVNSATYLPIPRINGFDLDIDAIEKAVSETANVKVVFACSPNNPNGSLINDADLKRLLALPVVVILDEAYIDFAMIDGAKSRMNWTLEYDNLVVLRTFSKLAGLAGLRVGYGAFPEWLLPHMWKIKQPYNVNVAAMLAATAALEDRDWLQEKMHLIVAERKRMVEQLKQFDYLQPFDSTSNFVLFRVNGRSALDLKLALEQQGVFVRYFKKEGVDNCIRITAGRPEDTDALIKALRAIDDQTL